MFFVNWTEEGSVRAINAKQVPKPFKIHLSSHHLRTDIAEKSFLAISELLAVKIMARASVSILGSCARVKLTHTTLYL